MPMSKKGGDLQAVQRKRPFARLSKWSVNLLLACLLVMCLDSASVSSPTCLYPSTRRNAKIAIIFSVLPQKGIKKESWVSSPNFLLISVNHLNCGYTATNSHVVLSQFVLQKSRISRIVPTVPRSLYEVFATPYLVKTCRLLR